MSKIKSFILLLTLLCTTNCFAFDEWTKTDTALQSVYTVLHVIDWGQTNNQAKNDWRRVVGQHMGGWDLYATREEINPILGKRPSVGKVNAYFASTLVAHTIISYVLPKPYRTLWQASTIGLELYVVGQNYNVAMKGFF